MPAFAGMTNQLERRPGSGPQIRAGDRGAYDQQDAQGFIRLNALRLRTLAARDRMKP